MLRFYSFISLALFAVSFFFLCEISFFVFVFVFYFFVFGKHVFICSNLFLALIWCVFIYDIYQNKFVYLYWWVWYHHLALQLMGGVCGLLTQEKEFKILEAKLNDNCFFYFQNQKNKKGIF